VAQGFYRVCDAGFAGFVAQGLHGLWRRGVCGAGFVASHTAFLMASALLARLNEVQTELQKSVTQALEEEKYELEKKLYFDYNHIASDNSDEEDVQEELTSEEFETLFENLYGVSRAEFQTKANAKFTSSHDTDSEEECEEADILEYAPETDKDKRTTILRDFVHKTAAATSNKKKQPYAAIGKSHESDDESDDDDSIPVVKRAKPIQSAQKNSAPVITTLVPSAQSANSASVSSTQSLIHHSNVSNVCSMSPLPPLMEHQKSAVDFIVERLKNKLSAALFHTMGLGKTRTCLEALTQYTMYKKANDSQSTLRVLLIAPRSLSKMWIEEYKRWKMTAFDMFGPVCTLTLDSHMRIWSMQGGVMVTTLGVFMNNVGKFEQDGCRPDILAIDEIHLMKNKDTKRWQTISQFSCELKIAMSGTPLQNLTLDLFNILELVQPGELGKVDVFKRLMQAGKDDGDIKGKMQVCANTIHTMASKIMHRRDESCLPLTCKKNEYIVTFDGGPHVRDSGDSDFVLKHETLKVSWESSHRKSLVCAIIDKAVELKRPILVFCYQRDIIEELHNMYDGKSRTRSLMLRGENTMHAQDLVNEFQKSDVMVFLSTTQAGRYGLTLTKANVVLIVDPSWNPQDDAQAICRAYRTGQVNDVDVYRLICDESIEVRIKRKQIFKAARSVRVMDNQDTDDIYELSQFFDRNPVDEDVGWYLQKDYPDPIWNHLQSAHGSLIRHAVPAERLTEKMNQMITPMRRFHWNNSWYQQLFYGEDCENILVSATIGIDCQPIFIHSWATTHEDNFIVTIRTRPYQPYEVIVQMVAKKTTFELSDIQEEDWMVLEEENILCKKDSDVIVISDLKAETGLGLSPGSLFFFSLRVRPDWNKVKLIGKEKPTHEAWSSPTMPVSNEVRNYCAYYRDAYM
jgi:SNF2 family DNA or RNA helicase